ncbi:hypothetical protein A2U01_0075631, partial [Trifolium medium]|nr:hypothetical protein [Trifolium medium]
TKEQSVTLKEKKVTLKSGRETSERESTPAGEGKVHMALNRETGHNKNQPGKGTTGNHIISNKGTEIRAIFLLEISPP